MQTTTAQKKALDHYYKELAAYHEKKVTHETAVRSAFQYLLSAFAQSANWVLIPEQRLANGKRPDGTLRDNFNLPRGYWEAKDTKDDLNTEIRKKISIGYPTTNTIFEDTRKAILYQNNRSVFEADLTKPKELTAVLDAFFHYAAPDIESFEHAVEDFKESIPDLAQGLLARIKEEHAKNKAFIAAFSSFLDQCRTSLDPNMSRETVDEMLVQHLLTERLFRTIFDNPDFINRNIIASEIEKVIQALTSRSFNRREFLKSLDRFYIAIENAARNLDDWSEKQHFLNTVYERFFQGFAVKQADTHGIVYTPQEIVDFMVESVDVVLKQEFGKSIQTPGVKILDPATGTGNFIVNIIRRLYGRALKEKYANDLFCNEIMLLPYYIASMNIEHEYYAQTQQYEPFKGICFADTLELAEGRQLPLFVEENTERVKREKEAEIMVVIGNPPYNAWQKSESDNNKNRSYPVIDEYVRKTYVKDSKATLRNMLYDAYVKFFRWATNRLQGRDGIVCFISNNSFVDQIAFDGMRKHLMKDFTYIYHLDLHGNVRKNPKLSGSTHNVFGIQVGVGITLAIRQSKASSSKLYYHRVPEYWNKTEKLAYLKEKGNVIEVDWDELKPVSTNRYIWRTEGMQPEFADFISLGEKETRIAKGLDGTIIFKIYSSGIASHRDSFVYSFNAIELQKRAEIFVDAYNVVVDSFKRIGREKDISYFVDNDNLRIKWTRQLKASLSKCQYSQYKSMYIRHCLYRPFTRKYLYSDDFWNEERYQQHLMFPNTMSESENITIGVAGPGADHQTVFATNLISDTKCGINGNSTTQCFPYYIYSPDGSNRRENITHWALKQFQVKYGEQVSKWDIFHYIYGMLHHPQYRSRYQENLKRDLPHIPLVLNEEAFKTCVRVASS